MNRQRFGISRLLLVAILAPALIAGCQGSKNVPPAPPPPAVTVALPVGNSVQVYHEYNGYLDAVDKVEVRPRVKGFINKVHFIEGAEVEAGKTVLYTIDPREYEAAVAKVEADIAKATSDSVNAEAQITLAQAKVDRLAKTGTGASATELDEAKAGLAAQQASLKSAKANIQSGEAALRQAKLNLEWTVIVADLSGKIGRTSATAGNFVTAESTLLTTIVKMDKLFVDFDIPEKNWIEYTKSPDASEDTPVKRTLPVEVGIATDIGYPHKGVIDFQDNKANPNTGTIPIRGRLDNPKREGGKPALLYSGLYAKVRVPIGEKREFPAIPEEAIMTGQEGRFVYVIGEGNMVQKRNVTVISTPVWKTAPPTTPPTPGWTLSDAGGGNPIPLQSVVAIEKGITLQDRVIVNGVLKVRPGSPATPELKVLQPPPAKP